MSFHDHIKKIFQEYKAPDGSLVRENFSNWFGSSKVVDEEGAPLVVYRGDRPNKTIFTGKEDPSVIIQGNIFFTDQARIGKFYVKNPDINYRTNYMIDPKDIGEEQGLYRVYLSLKNPLIVDAQGESWLDIPVPKGIKYSSKLIQIDDLAQLAKSTGKYDGLIIENVFDQAGPGNQYVAFSPEQIKSATKNSGAFDPLDPDTTDIKAALLARADMAERFIYNSEPSVQVLKTFSRTEINQSEKTPNRSSRP